MRRLPDDVHHRHRTGARERDSLDERLAVAVTARCVAAAVFGAMEVWMLREERSLPELAELCRAALDSLNHGMTDGLFRQY